ncbi:hypothetical protein [uncultured Sphingomonas sp.]|uniref:hypothetical protein n=1 Tax=uncultured Sphingomonas sp. TaxID=158754 RepID=UPI0025E2632C|nr:hypothetical protein [uncultured Sphingomonas sp.]
MTTIGLVVEGTNDFPAIEAFLEEVLPQEVARPLIFHMIQPGVDETTGRFGDGGWGRVVGWCKENSGEGVRTYFEPVFEGDKVCDFIVIQIDGDAVYDCLKHSNAEPIPANADVETRTKTLQYMIDGWLSAPEDLRGRFGHALPHLQTEAWIMAGLHPTQEPWESTPAKHLLWALKAGTGIKELPEFYRHTSKQAAMNCVAVAEQCISFQIFQQSVGKMVA